MAHPIATGDSFRQDEVWESPRGTVFRVMGFVHKEGKVRKQAILREGVDGKGRKQERDWDAVEGWVIHTHADGTKPE